MHTPLLPRRPHQLHAHDPRRAAAGQRHRLPGAAAWEPGHSVNGFVLVREPGVLDLGSLHHPAAEEAMLAQQLGCRLDYENICLLGEACRVAEKVRRGKVWASLRGSSRVGAGLCLAAACPWLHIHAGSQLPAASRRPENPYAMTPGMRPATHKQQIKASWLAGSQGRQAGRGWATRCLTADLMPACGGCGAARHPQTLPGRRPPRRPPLHRPPAAGIRRNKSAEIRGVHSSSADQFERQCTRLVSYRKRTTGQLRSSLCYALNLQRGPTEDTRPRS